MNKETLNELKERALKATKGPWMTWPTTACNGEYTGLDVMTHDGGALITEETHPSDDDAMFIAAANPAAILELIALAEHSLSAQDEVISDLNAINRAMQHMGDQLNEMDVVEEDDVAIVTPGFEAISRLLTTQSPSLAVREKPNADCSGEPANCPDNEGYGCACDPMNKAAKGGAA